MRIPVLAGVAAVSSRPDHWITKLLAAAGPAHQARLLYAARALTSCSDDPQPARLASPMIPDIAAKSGIFASDIPILNGSKRANEHFSGTFWQRDSG